MAIHYRTVVSSEFLDKLEAELMFFDDTCVSHAGNSRFVDMHKSVSPEVFSRVLRETWAEVLRPDIGALLGSVVSVNEDSSAECLRGMGLGPRTIHLWSKTS